MRFIKNVSNYTEPRITTAQRQTLLSDELLKKSREIALLEQEKSRLNYRFNQLSDPQYQWQLMKQIKKKEKKLQSLEKIRAQCIRNQSKRNKLFEKQKNNPNARNLNDINNFINSLYEKIDEIQVKTKKNQKQKILFESKTKELSTRLNKLEIVNQYYISPNIESPLNQELEPLQKQINGLNIQIKAIKLKFKNRFNDYNSYYNSLVRKQKELLLNLKEKTINLQRYHELIQDLCEKSGIKQLSLKLQNLSLNNQSFTQSPRSQSIVRQSDEQFRQDINLSFKVDLQNASLSIDSHQNQTSIIESVNQTFHGNTSVQLEEFDKLKNQNISHSVKSSKKINESPKILYPKVINEQNETKKETVVENKVQEKQSIMTRPNLRKKRNQSQSNAEPKEQNQSQKSNDFQFVTIPESQFEESIHQSIPQKEIKIETKINEEEKQNLQVNVEKQNLQIPVQPTSEIPVLSRPRRMLKEKQQNQVQTTNQQTSSTRNREHLLSENSNLPPQNQYIFENQIIEKPPLLLNFQTNNNTVQETNNKRDRSHLQNQSTDFVQMFKPQEKPRVGVNYFSDIDLEEEFL